MAQALGAVSRLAWIWQSLLGVLASALASAQAPAPPAIAQAYLYVEPYQARVEVLFDAPRVLQWLNRPPPAGEILTPQLQQEISKAVGEVAGGWAQLQAQGQPIEGAFLGGAIIKGRPGATLPFEEGTAINLTDAMVGLTWEFPTAAAPESLLLSWSGFDRFPIAELPVLVFFGQSETLRLRPDQIGAEWQNLGRLSGPPALAEVPPAIIPPRHWRWLGIGWIVLGLVVVAWVAVRQFPKPGGTGVAVILWLAGGSAFLVLDNMARSSAGVGNPRQAEAVLHPLLRNVYRAFDRRSESEIYDVLARSVSGDLLRTLYLETIQALTLEGREGTRVTIKDFDVTVESVHQPETGTPKGAFAATCQWTALGNVGHWGHTHTRVNRYTAVVTVVPEAGAWKIIDLQVMEARRL